MRDLTPEVLLAAVNAWVEIESPTQDAEAVEGRKGVILWHAALNEGLEDLMKEQAGKRPAMILGGGSTVGMRALYLAFTSGFRRIHAYGLDGSYHGEEHHAFAQPLNDGEDRITMMMMGQTYSCSPWMVRQANEFYPHWMALIRGGAKLWIHGRGLIPDMAAILQQQWADAQKKAA